MEKKRKKKTNIENKERKIEGERVRDRKKGEGRTRGGRWGEKSKLQRNA